MMQMNPLRTLALLPALLMLGGCVSSSTQTASTEAVRITTLDSRLRVEVGGKLFTEYYFKDVPRPYYYPVLGPGELPMTRDWPMKSPAGEEHDHRHHRSLWFAHGDVNGLDFWTEEKSWCKIVHERFTEIKSGRNFGVIQSRNNWVGPDGKIVCTDERTMRVYNRPDSERLFDFEITLHAPADKPVVLGDTKEGTMAIRVAESMRVTHPGNKKGLGHILTSNGLKDSEAWGKRADWVDYYGPVQSNTVGVAIFDHPANPRHPTTWHVRDYGLFAVNPFGLHDFSKEPKGAGNLTIPAGGSVTFRYRFYIHEGDTVQARVSEYYKDYINHK
jgi:hypothetical protein